MPETEASSTDKRTRKTEAILIQRMLPNPDETWADMGAAVPNTTDAAKQFICRQTVPSTYRIIRVVETVETETGLRIKTDVTAPKKAGRPKGARNKPVMADPPLYAKEPVVTIHAGTKHIPVDDLIHRFSQGAVAANAPASSVASTTTNPMTGGTNHETEF